MKSPFIKFFSFAIVIALLGTAGISNPGQESKSEVLIRLIMDRLNTGHFTFHNIDDQFSRDVYDLYLKRLDYSKRFLTQEDIEKMEPHKDKIDDQVKAGNYEFFELSNRLFEKRLKLVEGYYTELLSQPFDFTVKESINLDNEIMNFAKNEKELKEGWRKMLKYTTLSTMEDMIRKQEEKQEKGIDTIRMKSVSEIEKAARAKVLKTYTDWYNRMHKEDINDRRTTYLNAITNIYDPHSGYFPPTEKENFDIRMSGRLEGIGATLQEEDGYITVQAIVPGSASWKQGQLKMGDVILKVAQGAEEPVDIVDMKLDDAVKLIRGPKGTEVRLTVKNLDGVVTVIPIIRDVVLLEETYAKSIILQNENSGKIGYIKLPKFYADFNQQEGRNCSNDMAIEIEKLKAENVNGIILDLRNNGGGSLHDVVRMTGFFIEKGPIVQIKSRDGAPYIMDDKDPKVQYDGPLVVLVNSFSASASEILAAAIQDYGRGVVIGSPSTFGKGTVQRFVDLDDFYRSGEEEIKPLGSVKLTTQKFYRINGGATQLKGVIPDIILPDAYAYLENGESEREFPMKWDEIPPVAYSKWNLATDMNTIRQHSEARVKNSPFFQSVDENAQRIKRTRDLMEYSLHLETYLETRRQLKDEADKYKDLFSEIPGIEIQGIQSEMAEIEADTVKMASFSEWKKSIKKDHYVNEALSVLEELK